MVPPFFDPSGVDLSEPAARRVHARAARRAHGPRAPARRHRLRRDLRHGRAAGARRARGARGGARASASRRFRRAASTYDVTFAQTDVSHRAVKAILLAGAPRTAGGEEEELMLRATRAIIERPGTLPVRIGVNSGRVFAGIVGHAHTAHLHVLRRCDQHRGAHHGARGRRAAARARGACSSAPARPTPRRRSSRSPPRARPSSCALGRRRGRRRARARGDRPVRRPRGRARHAARRTGPGARRARHPRDRHGRRGPRQDAPAGEIEARASGIRVAARAMRADRGSTIPYAAFGALDTPRARGRPACAGAPPSSDGCARSSAQRAPQLEPWLPLLGLVVGLSLPPTPGERGPRGGLRLRAHRDERRGAARQPRPRRRADRDRRRALHGRGIGSADRPPRPGHRGAPLARSSSPIARATTASTLPEGVDRRRRCRSRRSSAAAALLARHPADRGRTAARARRRGDRRRARDGSPLFVTEMVAAMRGGADHDTLPESVEGSDGAADRRAGRAPTAESCGRPR